MSVALAERSRQADAPGPTPIPDGLIDALDTLQRPIVIGHVRPDADCFGSMFAAARSWPGKGRKVAHVALRAGSINRRLQFLFDWAAAPTATADDFQRADGFIVVDTAKHSRCNVDAALGEQWAGDRPIINIDHHASNTCFGRFDWIDAHAGSAAELVYRLIRAAGRPIDDVVASLLYAGIHSDTLGFSLPTTTASALEAAGDLVRCGARVAEIGERLCRSQSQAEFNLNRLIYGNTRVVADDRIAYSTANHDEITRTGCSAADVDDQVTIPRSIDSIKVAVLFTEGAPGKTRLNLRGERGVNVLDIALSLGGGGHRESAGAILDVGIDEAVKRVIPIITAALDAPVPKS
ncbi:MAG: bifunctional oligoribonuclease/PAP phosphatase NrnA [Phycisphaerales bacterium]|nr:bifunctional oligoribonuclease/PAP phosphatase NrnA [Phycisphaerales bacterium]